MSEYLGGQSTPTWFERNADTLAPLLMASQGATMGFSDELLGMVDPRYKDAARASMDAYREEHPWMSLGLELGGGFALGGLGAGKVMASKALSPLAKALIASGIGAGVGGGYGAGLAEGDVRDRLPSAAAGAAGGAILGPATGYVFKGAGAGLRALQGPVKKTSILSRGLDVAADEADLLGSVIAQSPIQSGRLGEVAGGSALRNRPREVATAPTSREMFGAIKQNVIQREKLTPTEQRALNEYSHPKISIQEKPGTIDEATMQSALNSVAYKHQTTAPMTVYRGLNEDTMKQLADGTYTFDKPGAASLSREIGDIFNHNLALEIEVPVGTHMAPINLGKHVKPNHNWTTFAGELVFPRGTKLQVGKPYQVTDENGFTINYAKAKVVSQPGQGGDKLLGHHASPYDFDKFSTKFTGTGEGSTAFGEGVYIAQGKPVAQFYWDRFVRINPIKYDGQNIKNLNPLGSPQETALHQFSSGLMNGMSPQQAKASTVAFFEKAGEPAVARAAKDLDLDRLEYTKPKMYDVELDATMDDLFDLDTYWRDQPQAVKEKLEPLLKRQGVKGYKSMSGEQIYHKLSKTYGNLYDKAIGDIVPGSARASQEMDRAGVKGLAYWDLGSRDQGAGTRNYVVFNGDTINILKKYGIIGTAGGAAAAVHQGEDDGT